MYTLDQLLGVSGDQLARMDHLDPQTPNSRVFATTEAHLEPPDNVGQALLDPRGSAIFWIALAALLGLVLVTGQIRLEAALGGRAGKR